MRPNQQLNDPNGKQVCLFPLQGFSISQPWWGTYSHEGGATYYATDFVPYDSNGTILFRAPCYAPVDIELLYIDRGEAMALWQSVNPVHFADGSIDYLGLICYHDNDIENNNYFSIGTIKRQGEVFFHSGTGGSADGDHVHLETGKGQVNLNNYRYHFTDNSQCKRIVPDNALFVNDTNVITNQYSSGYSWKIFEELPEELKRYGTYGVYYGNLFDSSQALTLRQMQINAEYIYRALTDKGWTLNAIAGILGNMQSESSINPRTLAK